MEDYGMHFSPDSWSSGSGVEVSLHFEETSDTSETVSSSVSGVKQDFAVPRSQDGDITATLHDPSTAQEKPKGKARVVFTERQLNILVHQFNLKRYYEPREMKQLAEMTGLTYKQVKTWFQNRRSKFRRRSHPQHVNQGVPLHFQGEGQPPFRQQYTQHLEVNSITNGGNYQGPYHHAVDNSAPGRQWTFPNSPQMFGWSMPPGNGQSEFNPAAGMNVHEEYYMPLA